MERHTPYHGDYNPSGRQGGEPKSSEEGRDVEHCLDAVQCVSKSSPLCGDYHLLEAGIEEIDSEATINEEQVEKQNDHVLWGK